MADIAPANVESLVDNGKLLVEDTSAEAVEKADEGILV